MDRVAAENPRILNLESDYLERQPRIIVQIDRNKAADLGVAGDRRTYARDHDGFAHRRPPSNVPARNTTSSCRRANAATRLGGRPRQSLCALGQERRPAATVGHGADRRARRARGTAPHGSHARHRAGRLTRARVRPRRRRTVHGAGDPRGSSHRADHLQRRDLPAQEIRRHVVDHLRIRAAGGVPGAGGAIRELHPPGGDR